MKDIDSYIAAITLLTEYKNLPEARKLLDKTIEIIKLDKTFLTNSYAPLDRIEELAECYANLSDSVKASEITVKFIELLLGDKLP